MTENHGLWLKKKIVVQPWWSDVDPNQLHWFPVYCSNGRCTLDLREAAMDSIPDEVLDFVSELDEVHFSADTLEACMNTSTLHKLKSHKKLHLSVHGERNGIRPSCLAVLPNLVGLTISCRQRPLELAEGDGRLLTGLTSLSLRNCHVDELPQWFPVVMSGLLKLNLYECHLSELPVSFKDFSNLKSLHMQSGCYINVENICLPTSLKNLSLCGNIVSESVPDDFCSSLTLLQRLTLNGRTYQSSDSLSGVRVLPLSINCLKLLTFLDLSGNRLETLSSTFSDLRHLTTIRLSHNALSSFPRVLLVLTGLKRLDMSHNEISGFPNEEYKLYSLEMLDLSWNRIVELPREIEK
jgi:Leucine-rich repeat (LRR) protein